MTNPMLAFLLLAVSLTLMAIALAGCGRIDAVRLEHPITGEDARCGPYTGLEPNHLS